MAKKTTNVTPINNAVKAATNGETPLKGLPEVSLNTDKARKAVAASIDLIKEAYVHERKAGEYVGLLAKERMGVSATVYKIAQEAQKLGGNDILRIRAYFKDLCAAAEMALFEELKSKDGGKVEVIGSEGEKQIVDISAMSVSGAIRTVMVSWGQVKSNIDGGMDKYDLNPKNFDSEGAFRKAKAEKAKAAGTSRSPGGETKQTETPDGRAKGADASPNPELVGMDPICRKTLTHIQEAVLALPIKVQSAKAVKILSECRNQLAALAKESSERTVRASDDTPHAAPQAASAG